LASLPDAGSGVEDMEFSWDEYLEDTGAVAAPHGSFKHVSKGMSLLTVSYITFFNTLKFKVSLS